ncbi:hypothetical protein FHW88_004693 [Mucilaginibacter sp. SG538B]|nr:hypothetical protein [Mucilaginibacter sp. SG538B]
MYEISLDFLVYNKGRRCTLVISKHALGLQIKNLSKQIRAYAWALKACISISFLYTPLF